MNLHTPPQTPDWKHRRPEVVTVWQRIAIASNGVCTIGNILSVVGLVLVLLGAYKLYERNLFVGFCLIFVGRLADLADGYAADKTHTKSRLGEIFDTTCDKIGIFVVAIAVLLAHLIPLFTIICITAYNIYLAFFGLRWGRRFNLHTNIFGKFTMFAAWAAILTAILYKYTPGSITLTVSIIFLLLFLGAAFVTIHAYWQNLKLVSELRKTKT